MTRTTDDDGRTTTADRHTPSGDLARFLRARGARVRIVAWVLLLVLGSLAVVIAVTWRLQIGTTDARMDTALRTEIEEFTALTASGRSPTDGAPFASVDQVLQTAITYNLARPNEKFLGYLDGVFRYQSRQQSPVLLANDPEFARLAGTVSAPVEARYASAAGEVRYIAVPVTLAGDPARGVIVVAYFADQERSATNDAAALMVVVGAVTALLAAGAAWLVAGRILRPVRDVADTARAITETDLSGAHHHRCGGPRRARRPRPGGQRDARPRSRTAFARPAPRSSTTPGTSCAPRSRSCAGTSSCSTRRPVRCRARRSPLVDRRAGPDEPHRQRPARARQGRPARLRLRPGRSTSRAARPTTSAARRARSPTASWRPATTSADGDVLTSTRSGSPRRCSQLAHNAVHHTAPGDRIVLGSRGRRRRRCGCGSPTRAPGAAADRERSSSGSPAAPARRAARTAPASGSRSSGRIADGARRAGASCVGAAGRRRHVRPGAAFAVPPRTRRR